MALFIHNISRYIYSLGDVLLYCAIIFYSQF